MAKKTSRSAPRTSATRTRPSTKTARKSAKTAAKSSRRESIDTGTDARYAKRAAGGRFKEMDDVARSQRTDKAKAAKRSVPSGYGDQGDRRIAKKR
jgi:hypothetical protein